MRTKAAFIFLLACAAAAEPCRAQLLYYDYDNSRNTAVNSFSTQGTLIAGLDLKGANIYTSGWFRNYDAQQGFFGQAYGGGYFYAYSNVRWDLTGTGNTPYLIFRDNYASTIRGYLYSNGNFGLLGSTGNWMLYVGSGGNRVYFPSSSGLYLNGSLAVKETQSTYGSIAFASGNNTWNGLVFGTAVDSPIWMANGNSFGQYNQNVWNWENLWDNGARTWTFYGNFSVQSPYVLYSAGRRVLTKVIIVEAAVGQYSACTPPSCPGGSSDIGSWTSGYYCWRQCLFGNNSGWGSLP